MRCLFIDRAKGILILFVLIHHFPHVLYMWDVNNNSFYNWINMFDFVYRPYFMPAFFLITGFCTNFYKTSVKEFVISNVKSLVIPSFTLGLLCKFVLNSIVNYDSIQSLLTSYLIHFIKNGGSYWFVTSLFFCKILYKSFHKNRYVWLYVIVITIIGFILHKYKLPNPYYIHQSCFMILFIYIGDKLKTLHDKLFTNNSITVLSTILYFITIVLLYRCHIEIPSVTMVITISSLSSFFISLFISIIGCIMVMNLSVLISCNTYLIYIGQKTLIIYMMHILIYNILTMLFQSSLIQLNSIILSFLLFISIIVLTLFYCCAIERLVNLKCFKWIVGKF